MPERSTRLCSRVCAVSYRDVNEVARAIDADITVVSLEPTSIEGILNTITTVGAMAEVEDDALDLVETLRSRLGAVEEVVTARRDAGHMGPRVVAVEWLDPPFAVGHWVPEQIRRAGGWDLLGRDGEKAVETTWDAVRDVDPETLVLMPCGYHLTETVTERQMTNVDQNLPPRRELPVSTVQLAAITGRTAGAHECGIDLLHVVPERAQAERVREPLRRIDREDERTLAAARGSECERRRGGGLAHASGADTDDDAPLQQNVD